MKRQRKKGRILMAAGVLLLAAAMGLTGYNLWDEARAEESAVEVLTYISAQAPEPKEYDPIEPEPIYKLFPEMEMPTMEIDGHRYVGTLTIPVLELQLPVMNEWSYPNLKVSPCRLTGSAYTGDLVICGHNYKTHFGPLNQLAAGDEVVFTDMDGNVFRYQVAETEILAPTAVQEMLEDGWDLTLFTCTYGGRTRFTVRCLAAQE